MNRNLLSTSSSSSLATVVVEMENSRRNPFYPTLKGPIPRCHTTSFLRSTTMLSLRSSEHLSVGISST